MAVRNMGIVKTAPFFFFVVFGIFLTYEGFKCRENESMLLDTPDSSENIVKNKNTIFLPKPVILVTYGRSGSSFLGNILKIDKNVFYIFEPLAFLRFNGYKTLHLLNGEKRSFVSFLSAAEFVIKNALKCQFKMMPLEYWNGQFADENQNGHQLLAFYKKHAKKQENRYIEPDLLREVIATLEAECLNSYYIIIKTIRTPLFLLTNLIGSIENIKIIHLVRDPRPTIASQRQNLYGGKGLGAESVSYHARNFCARVYHDILTFDIFSLYYPDKLLRIRYEDLSTQSLNITKTLCGFLTLTFTRRLAWAVMGMTSSSKPVRHDNFLKTVRQDSKTFIDNWRSRERYEFARNVDTQCVAVYSRLGYKSISSKVPLNNVSIPLFEKNFNDSKHLRFGSEIPL